MDEESDPRIRRVEIALPTTDLDGDLRFLTERLGFRLERIWPADDPAFAALTGHGAAVRLERNPVSAPVGLRLGVDDPSRFPGELVSPGGHRITVEAVNPPLTAPEAAPRFLVRRLGDGAWIPGRAGLLYRDLIPGRLGGAMIASHIRIPGGGPVPDLVHYHRVLFQLIFCHRGSVRVVYEDQGPPFDLEAGDLVIQPPEIRHRVLEASAGAEVIEIGVPAEHLTSMDRELELPTPHLRPDRDFSGTRFVRSRAAEARWTEGPVPGFEIRETGIGRATGGVAEVVFARRLPGSPAPVFRHRADIAFGFVRSGAMTLAPKGSASVALRAGDALVLPPNSPATITDPAADLEILAVALPADCAPAGQAVEKVPRAPTRREAPPGRVLPPRESGRNGSRKRFGPPSGGESAPHPPGRRGSPSLRGRIPMRGVLSTGC